PVPPLAWLGPGNCDDAPGHGDGDDGRRQRPVAAGGHADDHPGDGVEPACPPIGGPVRGGCRGPRGPPGPVALIPLGAIARSRRRAARGEAPRLEAGILKTCTAGGTYDASGRGNCQGPGASGAARVARLLASPSADGDPAKGG